MVPTTWTVRVRYQPPTLYEYNVDDGAAVITLLSSKRPPVLPPEIVQRFECLWRLGLLPTGDQSVCPFARNTVNWSGLPQTEIDYLNCRPLHLIHWTTPVTYLYRQRQERDTPARKGYPLFHFFCSFSTQPPFFVTLQFCFLLSTNPLVLFLCSPTI